jgi:hypothetical protein
MTDELPAAVRLLALGIPAGDRQAILGDLLEDASDRRIGGTRRDLWLIGECAAIAAGLTGTRLRAWLVVPPVREVAVGLAVDGRGVLRGGHPLGALVRALLFMGSVAMLAMGVEVLVGSLLSASGLGR